jgi:hypothetical protein
MWKEIEVRAVLHARSVDRIGSGSSGGWEPSYVRKDLSADFGRLVRDERRNWRDQRLLAPRALRDFQKLSDEAFDSMRRKYFCPADLVAEMRLWRPKAWSPARRSMDSSGL